MEGEREWAFDRSCTSRSPVIQWKAKEITWLLAYRMGNAAICGDNADVDFVTVLRGNGTVLTFYNPMRVAVLLQGYPGHFVCHSSSLLLMHEGKILPPHTILAPGETYFLLPVPCRKSNSDNDSTTSPSSCPQRQAGLPQQEDSRTMKFAVSNELFAKILSGSSMREDSLSKSSKQRRNEERTPLLERLKSWEPRVCTVAEVTAKWLADSWYCENLLVSLASMRWSLPQRICLTPSWRLHKRSVARTHQWTQFDTRESHPEFWHVFSVVMLTPFLHSCCAAPCCEHWLFVLLHRWCSDACGGWINRSKKTKRLLGNRHHVNTGLLLLSSSTRHLENKEGHLSSGICKSLM